MNTLQLSPEDNRVINDVLSKLCRQYKTPCQETFLLQVHSYAWQLPPNMLMQLEAFKYSDEHNGTLLISGFYIDDQELEPTPQVTGLQVDEFSAIREGFLLMMLTSLLGDVFGWSSQRNGALINNILPLRSHEAEQLSTGSMVDLDWHTEEAFHPFRADYLALMCLRNPDNVPTVLGSIQDVHLDDATKKILFEPRFHFLPDKNFDNDRFDVRAPASVLFGDFEAPYVKIDPSFMETMPGDAAAQQALATITHAFRESLYDQVLQQGDILFLDNYRVVHGRKAFNPRFDGNDRWLKRVNVTADLRKSRVLRKFHCSRIISTN